MILDGFGIYGMYLHAALIIFFVGGAFMLFLILWKMKRLDMDEEPKHIMMKSDEEEVDGIQQ